MENYIVRIYRRDPDDSDKVSGTLESVEQETRRPFHSLESLPEMLDIPAEVTLPPGDSKATADTEPCGRAITLPRIRQRTDYN